MALTDAIIGDKPVKVEVDLSKSTQAIVICVIIGFVIITYLIVTHRQPKTN